MPIFRAFQESDLFGKLILIVLFAFSVFAHPDWIRAFLTPNGPRYLRQFL